MGGTWQERALLLRFRDLGESDLVIDALGEASGRFSAVAKGARRSQKRFVGVLLTAQVVSAVLVRPKRGLVRLEEAKVVEAFRGLREQWRRWVFASVVIELLSLLVPEGQGRGLVWLGAGALGRIEQGARAAEMGSAVVVFMSRLAGELGYGLNLHECIECGGPPAVAGKAVAVSSVGGVVCRRHKGAPGVHMLPVGLVKSMEAAGRLAPAGLWRLELDRGWVQPAMKFWQEFWERLVARELPALSEARELVERRGG